MHPASPAYRWYLPRSAKQPNQLKILNSFTRKKEDFISNETKIVKWYSCGPTVYDVSHLGHARCYITFDIIRRILQDYFGYHVYYVMNITDIDDKIIKRARSSFLCDKFIEHFIECSSEDDHLLMQIGESITNYQLRRLDEKEPAKLTMISEILTSSRNALELLKKAMETCSSRVELKPLLSKLRDVIADEQDSKFAASVDDLKIFKALSLKFEKEFHEDMIQLDILPPSCLTRVSDYIDEIGAYLAKLEANGFAYRVNGSVYFDTEKFNRDSKHSYAKLVPEAYGERKSLNEGEGELSQAQSDTKRSPNDFALWKKSKVGEPSWSTLDYEAGRPGWHIECSVMACHALGDNFDIHSGGCDLKFPHHDNEIAQAEAYYNTGKDWVNYFIHSGHLSISGCKMSKSLKNFITIRQALDSYTSRQLRFAFLAHTWSETLDYSANTMNTAISYEKTFKEFFFSVIDNLRRRLDSLKPDNDECTKSNNICNIFSKWTEQDYQLNNELLNTVELVDKSLCDNFDTRSTLNCLSALVKECNKRAEADAVLLGDIALYIMKILNIFGVKFNEIDLNIFYRQRDADSSSNTADQKSNLKLIKALADFRADIRKLTKCSDPQKSLKEILASCDTIRDQVLPSLGICLEDRELDGVPYVVKLVDPETLAREKAQAERRDHEKRIKEEAARLEKLKLQQQREQKAKIPPSELFKSQTDKYSKFDEKGLPTHDSAGKEITKSAQKKLLRLYLEQEARYKKYISDQSTSQDDER